MLRPSPLAPHPSPKWAWMWLLAAFVTAAPQAARAQQRTSPVFAARVIEAEVASGQVSVGTVTPSRRAIIGSAVDGRVVEFPHNEGDRVEAKQPLAQLLTATIELELQAAEAELKLREEELAELVAGSRPEEIAQAEARMAAAAAKKQYTAARRDRIVNLFKANRVVTEEDRDESVSLATEAEKAFLDAEAAYQLAQAGPREEKKAQARARVAMQQAIVDKLKDQITKHTIISRFDGYITAEHTEIGQWVSRGDPVAEVAALDEVDVVAYVVEQHVPHIKAGMDVRVEVPALSDRLFTGQVALVVPQADVRARTFPVKIRVKNEIGEDGPLLKSGMYARVTLPTGPGRKAILVPKDALVLGGAKPMVFVVPADAVNGRTGKVSPVPVELGVAAGPLIQVTGPLQAGQVVVVRGNERLRPGQDVTITRLLETRPPGEETLEPPTP